MELKVVELTLDNLRHADDTTLVAILSVNLENLGLANSEIWFLKKAERQTIAA
jgi:phenylpyruvate tautomerase PptA (4-oxalocrotonate tautomerase family)